MYCKESPHRLKLLLKHYMYGGGEGSGFLTVLCTEDQSSSQSSSTHVALALHGLFQPARSVNAHYLLVSSLKCRPPFFVEPCLNKTEVDVALLRMFCGLFFHLSDQKFGAFYVTVVVRFC